MNQFIKLKSVKYLKIEKMFMNSRIIYFSIMKVKLEIIQGALLTALIILFSTSISNPAAGKTTVSENY